MEGYTYKVSAQTSNGSNLCLADYISSSNENGIYEIFNIIEDAKGNADTAARKLNAHKDIYDTFKPFRTIPNGFILQAKDCWGNKSFITVRKEHV